MITKSGMVDRSSANKIVSELTMCACLDALIPKFIRMELAIAWITISESRISVLPVLNILGCLPMD
jgi:hypothetical protein